MLRTKQQMEEKGCQTSMIHSASLATLSRTLNKLSSVNQAVHLQALIAAAIHQKEWPQLDQQLL